MAFWGAEHRGKGRPTGPGERFEVGQMDQVRGIWNFVNI